MGELANLFYATLELRDSASFYYRRLLTEYPEGPASARALFVLGQIASSDSSEGRAVADSLYRVVLSRFPRSEFAGEVRRLLGLPAEKSSSDSAEVLYARAEEILLKARAADLSPAIAALQTVVERYPASPVAPRAMYAIGWTYEKGLLLPDSALSAYRRLLAAYPASQFALAVRPLVTEADAAAAGRAAPKDSTSVAAPPAIDPKQPPPARPEEQDPEVRRTRRTPVTPPPQPPPAVPGQERPKD
jgi:TolA-binding protein